MNNKIAVWIAIAVVLGAVVYLFIKQSKKQPSSSSSASGYTIKTDEELKKYLEINY